MRPLLVELGRRTGQSGLLDLVHLLVKAPSALRKTPCLILVGLRRGVHAHNATADDLDGAVLLYEYTVGPFRTGLFATDDISGARTVLAPRERRAQVAEQACRILAAHGATMSLISVEGAAPGPRLAQPGLLPDGSCRIGMRVRSQARDLHLGATLEATMAAFGRNTRRNFRRYRQRAEDDLGAVFVPSVALAPEQFLELNRRSTNPVPEDDAAWRHHYVTSSPNRLFAGLRARDGRWLSLIAGSRVGKDVRIEWQVNRGGLPRYSLTTVMRACVLEHEISLGTRTLLFEGGTPHSMGLSLSPGHVLDILAIRRGLPAGLLRWLGRWVLPRSNFLGRALQDKSLAWVA
ncbi:MAG: hypothetical protein M3O02_01510 [Acidobacteriota bacterium]|nr:hypothetical protein [Acidobacteriota bacterium]